MPCWGGGGLRVPWYLQGSQIGRDEIRNALSLLYFLFSNFPITSCFFCFHFLLSYCFYFFLNPMSSSTNVFSCKCIFSLTMGCSNIKLCWCMGHMMSRVLGNISCDLDPLDPGSRSNNVFSCKCISLTIGGSNFKLCRYIGHIM